MNRDKLINILKKINVPYVPGPAKNITADHVGIKCPFCIDDPSQHLGIDENSGLFKCWRCKEKGPLIYLIRKLISLPEQQCKELIQEGETDFKQDSLETIQNIIDGEPDKPKQQQDFPGLPRFYRKITTDINFPLLTSYMKRRGITILTLIQYECGICRVGQYANRMIIPVIFGGKTVSFVAADMTKAPDKKYKNAPGDINDYIYGYDEIKDGGRIIITEGVLDKWRIGQDAVATLGTHITNRQQRLILDKHPSELIFCYDEDYYLKEIQFNDIPGQFMPFVPKIKIVKFPAGIDPDKYGLVYGKEKLMELINTTEHWGG